MRALAHIGVHTLHITNGPISFLAPLQRRSFSVDNDKRQLDITLEFFLLLFYFDFTSACNLVFVFLV